MKRDDLSDHETFVQIREGTWRFRNLRGTIAATVPVTCHEQFRELAVLEVPGFDKPRYAARAAGDRSARRPGQPTDNSRAGRGNDPGGPRDQRELS